MATDVRILLLADSHVGFDLPLAPRVARRRRGHDFLANHSAALEPAVLVAGRRVSVKIEPGGKSTWQDGELERLVREFRR